MDKQFERMMDLAIHDDLTGAGIKLSAQQITIALELADKLEDGLNEAMAKVTDSIDYPMSENKVVAGLLRSAVSWALSRVMAGFGVYDMELDFVNIVNVFGETWEIIKERMANVEVQEELQNLVKRHNQSLKGTTISVVCSLDDLENATLNI